jgi:flagellar basal-body rod protein FlgF
MSDGIYTALSGAMVMDQNLEILSNNLANTGTPGFKSVRPVFQSVLTRAQGAGPGADRPDARVGVEMAQVSADFTQGELMETGGDLDIALEGDGFLAVETAQGVRYTRRGAIQLDEDRRLTIGGAPLRQPGGGELVLPQNSYVSFGADGSVYADEQPIGQLEIVRFDDPGALQAVGGGFYQGGGAQPDEVSTVHQGYLEGSNVNPVWGMTELIRVTRTFEASQKVIQTYRDMDRKLTGEIGRV